MRFLSVFVVLLIFSPLFSSGAGEEELNNLTLRQQSIIAIAAHTATGDLEQLKGSIQEGLDRGLTVNETGEILLQIYAYAGFPRSLNGMGVLRNVLMEREDSGIVDVRGDLPDPFLPNMDKYFLGADNIAHLTGRRGGERPEGNGYEQAMDTFLKEHLFADIIGRDNLSYAERELVTVGVLSSLPGLEPQLHAHINGAMNLGITGEQMADAASLIETYINRERGDSVRKVLQDVLERREESGAGLSPAEEKDMTSYMQDLFPRGDRASIETIFTGPVWINWMTSREDNLDCSLANVTFEPDSRTKWHAHDEVQILLAEMGRGYYQEEGEPALELKPGDMVIIKPGVKHWHGAAPGNWFSHISITTPGDGSVESGFWEPVDDKAYYALP